MDILRIDSDEGVFHVRGDALLSISQHPEDPAKSLLLFHLGGGVSKLTVAGDVDEVAAQFETSSAKFRIHRIN